MKSVPTVCSGLFQYLRWSHRHGDEFPHPRQCHASYIVVKQRQLKLIAFVSVMFVEFEPLKSTASNRQYSESHASVITPRVHGTVDWVLFWNQYVGFSCLCDFFHSAGMVLDVTVLHARTRRVRYTLVTSIWAVYRTCVVCIINHFEAPLRDAGRSAWISLAVLSLYILTSV